MFSFRSPPSLPSPCVSSSKPIELATAAPASVVAWPFCFIESDSFPAASISATCVLLSLLFVISGSTLSFNITFCSTAASPFPLSKFITVSSGLMFSLRFPSSFPLLFFWSSDFFPAPSSSPSSDSSSSGFGKTDSIFSDQILYQLACGTCSGPE